VLWVPRAGEEAALVDLTDLERLAREGLPGIELDLSQFVHELSLGAASRALEQLARDQVGGTKNDAGVGGWAECNLLDLPPPA